MPFVYHAHGIYDINSRVIIYSITTMTDRIANAKRNEWRAQDEFSTICG